MTMVLGRSFYRNDPISSYRGFGRDSRPMLKMPCSRYSVSLDSGRSYYESAISSHSYDTSSTSTSSSKFTNTVALSTPSPSATANGNKVDFEFEKLRRLSEEWLRNREIEEAENIVLNLRSRSPSPQCSLPPFKYYRRSSSQPSNTVTRDHRSPSPTRSPDRSTRSPSIQKSESPFRSLHSRSPSPLVFSPVSRTFVRSNSYDPDTSRSRSSPPRESSLPPNFSRRTSFFDQEKNYRPSPVRNGSPQRYSPVANIFRRSSSYDAEDAIRSNFRARSTSPQRLTPASSYYRKHSNSEDRDSGIYSSNYNSRSPSPQTSPHSLNLFNRNGIYSTPTSTETKFSHRSSFNNLKNFYGDSGSNKFHSLPRNLFSTRANSPKRESLFDLFTPNTFNRAYTNGGSPNSTSSTSARFNNLFNNLNHNNNNNSFNNSKPPLASSTRHCPAHFLPNTLPDLPSYRMMANTRRYSEEPSPFRRPLATLHEDDVVARRRFSDDLRKKSFETPDVAKELNNHQRKLSEAGVRKHSVPDASLVLTEDTDSFIIGDRVWVGGTKPGSISYIGETQFAPGEWAGVTLDEPIGKNNGSVAGVRYFQCEPKKGVFSRLTRLSRVPLSEHDLEYLASRPAARQSFNSVPKSSTTNAASTPLERKTSQGIDAARKTSQISEPSRKITPTSPGNKSPLSTKSGSPSPASSVKKAPLPSAGFGSELRIGERVVIDSSSGTKYGVLRYLGRTDFADGVWAGVELDEPTGKNDGSVAGKKYFVCRSKYGLFAPMGRVRSFSNRSSAPRSSLPTMRRSNSKESLGASSAASSNISSLRGTRRPIRTSTSSTSPSTKALQETLEEKTQHVDQLMRERDSDRLEMAKIATRLEETTRIAHDYKMQLDQLQIESEERLHDFGQKVQGMEREKKELLAKLEDKRKEIDDLNFRIEEETFAKADFESQSITTTERIKELEYLLEGEKKKLRERGEKEALKEDEMEEIEISLRTSIEDMQARVMEMERDKENTEKRLEEAEAKKKELETENASLSTSLRENEQRFSLIEAARESIEARAKELETELLRKTQEVARVTGEDSRDIEIAELKAKLKIISDAEELMKKELSGAQDEKQKLQESLTDVNSKVASLEEGKKSLEDELAKASETSKKSLEKITDLETTLTDKNKELEMLQVELEKGKHELTSNKECLQKEQENGKQKEEQNQELQTQLKEAQQKIKELEANTETATAKTSDLSQQVANARLRIEELEKVRRGLESELEVALTSSSATTDQLKEAKAKVEESASRAENEKNELVKEVEKLKEEAEEKEKMLRLLRLEKEGLQEDLENKTKAYEADVKEKDQHRARVEDQLKTQLEEQIKNYKNLSEQFENNSKAFKEEKEALTKEKEQVLADVATLEREKAELSQDKSTKETSLEKSEEMIKILVAEVESLKNQLATYREGLQKQVSLAEEDQKTMAVLRTSLDESQRQLNSLEENLIKTQEEKDESLSAKAALEEETKKLKGLEEKLVKDRERLEEELKELTALRHKNSELEGEKAKLEDDLKRLGAVESERNLEKERNETLTKELEALRILDAGVKALKADKQALEADVSRLNHELSQSKEESQKLTSRCHELEKVSERSAANSEEKSKTQTTMIESLEETKRCLTHELEKTKEELKKINVLEEENADLRRTVEELQKTSQEERICLETSNDALKKSYSEKVSDLETEKGNLVEEVVSLQDRLTNLRQEHETELGKYREKDSAKESEERQLAELRLKTLTLESDKRKLDAEVKMLKEKIALSQIGSGETDEFVVQLKQERDQFEGQLDFLNSVIVDLQKKKEDLETKVEILQSGNLPDDQKANLNGLMGVRAVAPRLFCDICDCFDLHDTEDCPKQTSEDSPPHSHYNADRHTVRAYCDTCEMFGHEDGECPTDETF